MLARAQVDGFPDGNWVGPTILEATTEMDCYQYAATLLFAYNQPLTRPYPLPLTRQEIFGPVLVVVKAANLNEGIKLINRNRCAYPLYPPFDFTSPSPHRLTLQNALRASAYRSHIPPNILDGNGASIFTQSGATARKFEKDVEAGQVGM